MQIGPSERLKRLQAHREALLACRLCPAMHPKPVTGQAVASQVLLVGQAPGVKEPVLERPFAWTAGKTLFRWFEEACGISEEQFRATIYMAAVCRCFPGKKEGGGDRVPAPAEIANCSRWLNAEIGLLAPKLVIPVGKLAISQFLTIEKLEQMIGKTFRGSRGAHAFDIIPLPHPSGASPWHRVEPGKTLTRGALSAIVSHRAFPKPFRTPHPTLHTHCNAN